jgi:hypothetical protein
MSKVTVAFGSLIVGATLGFFCGNHTSIVVQPASAAKGAIVVTAALPVVPGILLHTDGAHEVNSLQQLDGVEFKDSEFKGVTWEYSGGAFSLVNVKISTPMRVTLKGAAANTMALLAIVQAVNDGARPRPMNPNAPVLRQATEKHTVTIDLTSPYIGTDKTVPPR